MYPLAPFREFESRLDEIPASEPPVELSGAPAVAARRIELSDGRNARRGGESAPEQNEGEKREKSPTAKRKFRREERRESAETRAEQHGDRAARARHAPRGEKPRHDGAEVVVHAGAAAARLGASRLGCFHLHFPSRGWRPE